MGSIKINDVEHLSPPGGLAILVEGSGSGVDELVDSPVWGFRFDAGQ